MTKPTKAELYTEIGRLKTSLAEQYETLVATVAAREQYRNRSIELDETVQRRTDRVHELETCYAWAANHRDLHFNRVAELKRQLNRANWYVAAMFVATVSMAAMAAVAIFVC